MTDPRIRITRTFVYKSDWMTLSEAYPNMTLEQAKEYERTMDLSDLFDSGIMETIEQVDEPTFEVEETTNE